MSVPPRACRSRVVVRLFVACALLVAVSCSSERQAKATIPTKSNVLRILTPYAANDAPGFSESLDQFQADSGVQVEIVAAAGDLVDAALLDLTSPDHADAVVIPQPGLVRDLNAEGSIVPIPEEVTTKLKPRVLDGFSKLGTIDGRMLSVWTRASTSVIWYRADIFAAHGWQPPATFAEFLALVDKIAAEGPVAPLCVGLEAQSATGWYGTDWIESMLLAEYGPETYSRWVSHTLLFSSPEITKELTRLQSWLTDPRYVAGGPEAALKRPVEQGFAQLAQVKPVCAMNLNSDWVFPTIRDQIESGAVRISTELKQAALENQPTISAFAMPSSSPSHRAVVVGGDQLVALRDRPEVWQLMEAVASPDWGTNWAKQGAFVSPNVGFDASKYSSPASTITAKVLEQATHMQFDGADMMPTAVGAGSFWSGIVDLARGVDPEQVERDIDATWPKNAGN